MGGGAREPTRLDLMRDQVRYQPSSVAALFDLAFEYFRLRNYEDAVVLYKRVLTADGKDAEAWCNYGLGLFRTKRGDEARAACQRAGDLAKTHGRIQRNLAPAGRC